MNDRNEWSLGKKRTIVVAQYDDPPENVLNRTQANHECRSTTTMLHCWRQNHPKRQTLDGPMNRPRTNRRERSEHPRLIMTERNQEGRNNKTKPEKPVPFLLAFAAIIVAAMQTDGWRWTNDEHLQHHTKDSCTTKVFPKFENHLPPT